MSAKPEEKKEELKPVRGYIERNPTYRSESLELEEERVVGLRFSPEQETEGLDLALHDERAYNS